MANTSKKPILTVIIIAVIAVVGFAILTMPDRRTTGERVGDAIDALPQGVNKAAEQLEKRTPGEKLGDEIKRATDNE